MAERKKSVAQASESATAAPTDTPVAEVANTPQPAAKDSQEKEPASDSSGFCVYIGPTIQGVIQAGTVYGNSREKVISGLADAIQKYPLIAKLIVSGDTLATDRIKVKTPANQLYVLYRKLASGQKTV